ncbi:DUF1659 domain-containing protein [Halobacillus sp. BBL2006]|uniref:DUF1659 domain-containing protein n=1 Tax=Halobacillus sp. BBL2006 TaxID=1543706 RepID=UPI000543A73D|nr:DUF1659 domain-containing protein [Halobacillus sp. BBL2006]KHE66805.1 hypothetical protein LD39_20820 [Halobacillus sp. BBL2006]
MAISSEKVNTQLQMVFDNGVDEEGNPIFRTKSFNNVKTTSTPEQLHNVAVSIAQLQQRVLYTVERNDSFVIADL